MKKFVVLFFALAFKAAELQAQSIGSGSLFGEILLDWTNSVDVETSYMYAPPSDISGGSEGELATQQATATVKLQSISPTQRHALTAYLQYSHTDMDFDSTAIDLYNQTNRLTASAFYAYQIDRRWSAFATGALNFSAQSYCDWGNGMQGFIGAGAIYNFSRSLSIGAGAMAYSRMDRDWIGFPIAFIQWRINEKLTLKTFSGAALLWDVRGDERLVIDATFEYKNNYSRLDNGSSCADSWYQFSVGATYSPFKCCHIGVQVGGMFGREIEFRRTSLSDIDADAAPFVCINASMSF